MRLVIQNAEGLKLTANGEIRGTLEKALFVLVGVKKGDGHDTARAMAQKLANLRVIPDGNGKLNLAATDPSANYGIAVVSNFTLYADCAASRRPDFHLSASFDEGKAIYDAFLGYLRLELKESVQKNGGAIPEIITGVFGADMQIDFCATGPVTVIMDSDQPGMIK